MGKSEASVGGIFILVVACTKVFVVWFLFAVYIPWDHSNELTARLIEALIDLCTYIRKFLIVLMALMCAYYLYPKNYAVSFQYFGHLVLIYLYWFLWLQH